MSESSQPTYVEQLEYTIHNENEVDVIGDVSVVIVKRGRGRPRKIRELVTKRPRGRPRKIREPVEKRPRGRPRKWTEYDIVDKPKYIPKDFAYGY